MITYIAFQGHSIHETIQPSRVLSGKELLSHVAVPEIPRVPGKYFNVPGPGRWELVPR